MHYGLLLPHYKGRRPKLYNCQYVATYYKQIPEGAKNEQLLIYWTPKRTQSANCREQFCSSDETVVQSAFNSIY